MDSPLQIYDLCTAPILAEATDYGVHYIIYYLTCSSKLYSQRMQWCLTTKDWLKN